MRITRIPPTGGKLWRCQSLGWFYNLSLTLKTKADFKMTSTIGPSYVPPTLAELFYRVTAPDYELSAAIEIKSGGIHYFTAHTYTGTKYETTLYTLRSL